MAKLFPGPPTQESTPPPAVDFTDAQADEQQLDPGLRMAFRRLGRAVHENHIALHGTAPDSMPWDQLARLVQQGWRPHGGVEDEPTPPGQWLMTEHEWTGLWLWIDRLSDEVRDLAGSMLVAQAGKHKTAKLRALLEIGPGAMSIWSRTPTISPDAAPWVEPKEER